MKLALGTVQFGLDYGVSNKDGKTPIAEVEKIFKTAHEAGIQYIDTAYLYGNSEETIGKCLTSDHSFKIITKTAKGINAELLEKNLKESLCKLNQKKIYGLMLHDADDLIKDNGQFVNKLYEFKDKNIVEKIGVSVYTSEQIEKILENFQFDIIQLPLNVFDQRLIQSGHLKKLKDKNIKIFVRSIFLQGLLLMEYENINNYFEPLKPLIKKYFNFIENNGISKLEAAVSFVKNIKEIDYIVCGINNNSQLQEIIKVYNKTLDLDLGFQDFSCYNENYINPINWKYNQ